MDLGDSAAADKARLDQMIEQPEPYRNPLGWWQPTIRGGIGGASGPIEVEVAIPNEIPEVEDDITLVIKVTGEGVIIDGFVSSDQEIGTWAVEHEEIVRMLQ